ncbi:hypothetical protein M8C17_01290 [Micromonospora sp. RHAY321]|uniref:BTAD domain-containing putative transcriptional regulator n=1 Tax=Micromonospora sp. RHAY321 TaxID=2944807 RepID=UPI00207CEC6B|nr:BTAD domain-containing putative transcriptional regulator [Micromonospora sp. RHAY321]MCO1593794.1 hypothetical protein [Micromonospora sp. RHAY321]
MRRTRQVASLLFLALLLAVPPVVLVRIIGWPLTGWPTLPQVEQWVAQPLTEQTLTAALSVLAWLVWLLLAYTVTMRMLIRMLDSVRWLRRIPLPTPLQATATGVAGAAAFSVGAHTAADPPQQNAQPIAAGTEDGHSAARHDSHADTPYLAVDGGVLVPGGWLPDDVAQQVGAAAAMVWLRRRRAYHPTPPDREPRDQPDLAALPTTVAAVQAALSAEPTASPAPHDDSAAADAPVVLPAPVAGLPRGTIGFTGPGALAAARGALVTAALAGLRNPDAPPLVITRSALNALIGSATDHATGIPHVRVAATAQDAAAILSQPRTADPTGRDLATSDAAPRLPGQQPPLLIVDATAQGAASNWRAAAADTGTTLVLGPSLNGSTWVIDPSGYVTYPDGGTSKMRLCVLDPMAAADLLTVIGHAHSPGSQEHLPPAGPRIPRQSTSPKPSPQPLLSPVAGGRSKHRLEVRVLGQPTVLRDEQPLTIRRTAALQALVFLTVHPDGASSRELVQAIWPGLPTHTLTGRLYTTLSELRGTFRAAEVPTVIEHTEDRYRLNPTLLDADLWRFNALSNDATTAGTDRATAWKAVTDTYTGELADGHAWPWLQQPREATRRVAIDAYAALAAIETDPRQALTWLQRGIRVDPYNAELHQRAMTAFATLGDQSAIAALYDSYARRLVAAGLEPSDELRAVARHLARETLLPGR